MVISMRFEFSPEVKSIATFPHIELTAKALGESREKVAALEIIKAGLILGMFNATEKRDWDQLRFQMASESGAQAIADILRACYVDLKHAGIITENTLKMVYDMLATFESVPSFNRQKAMAYFVGILGEKVFVPVEEYAEEYVTREEFKQLVNMIQSLKEEISSLKEVAAKTVEQKVWR